MKTSSKKRFVSYITLLLPVLVFVVLHMFSCAKKEGFESYFPETGTTAIYNRALETKSCMNVLSFALEPGYEDLGALAYFRLGKGAHIVSAYLTNGEAGVNDIKGEYPNYIAATKRLEAGETIYYLDGNVHFLNFPHIVAARDSAFIREKWIKKTIETKLVDMINQYKPDIILVAPDRVSAEKSLRWHMFKNDLIAVVKKIASGVFDEKKNKAWQDTKILVANYENIGIQLPIDDQHPYIKKTYRTISSEAAQKYRSLSFQRTTWKKGETPSYSMDYPINRSQLTSLESILPRRDSAELFLLAEKIKRLTDTVLEEDKKTSLKELVAILDEVNSKIASRFRMSEPEKKALFFWKTGLERLQCSLLGIEVKFSVDEHIVTMSQVTKVDFQDIKGLPEEGKTTIYFSGLDEGWAVNEQVNQQFEYKPKEQFRLLTPKELTLTTPQAGYGLESAGIDRSITMNVMHQAPTKEQSFIHQSIIRFKFSPKFSTEVLTPIVRAIPGEKLVVRLTNHSRDGVRDTVQVMHELVESVPGPFRLNQKEASYVDSLMLIWKGDMKDGSSIIPIAIKTIEIGNFAVRQFETEVNPAKKIGILEDVKGSPLSSTLRRLAVDYVKLDINKNMTNQLQGLHVLVFDRRTLRNRSTFINHKEDIDQFIESGGHVILFPQHADDWNNIKPIDDVTLTYSQKFDERYPLLVDREHPFLNDPNPIFESDWQEWLYQRAHNIVEINSESDFEIPIRAKNEKTPFLLSKKVGEGRITYIDLAFHPQLLNIHVGTFRLFANILSI